MKHSCDTTIQGDSVARFEQKGFCACENGDGYHCVKVDREKNIVRSCRILTSEDIHLIAFSSQMTKLNILAEHLRKS